MQSGNAKALNSLLAVFPFKSLLPCERGPSSLIGCVSVLDMVPAPELVSTKETCVFASESLLCGGSVGGVMIQA